MIDSIGELVVGSIEFLAEIIDWGTWFGTRSPRIGERYRVRRQLDVSGQVLPTSGDIAGFEARLAPGTVLRIVAEPAPERTDVDVSVEGNAIEGIVPPAHHRTARAVGYVLQVPSVLLLSHCRRISRGGTPTSG